MSRRSTVLAGLVCMFLLLTGQTAMAESGGGAEPEQSGQTDIMAGVAVDYMGRLRFQVADRDTGSPIPEASVEIYMASLDRYVLFGVTDADGSLELDVAYENQSGRLNEPEGKAVFTGTTLFLKDNHIAYRIYKADWLPYPYDGTAVLETREIPQVITVPLYKKKSSGSGSGGGGGGGGSSSSGRRDPAQIVDALPVGNMNTPMVQLEKNPENTSGIPKTGVEGTMQYWIAGLLFFLLAGGIVTYLLKIEKYIDDRQREV